MWHRHYFQTHNVLSGYFAPTCVRIAVNAKTHALAALATALFEDSQSYPASAARLILCFCNRLNFNGHFLADPVQR
eukprot:2305179-Rhodomonas_salina.2